MLQDDPSLPHEATALTPGPSEHVMQEEGPLASGGAGMQAVLPPTILLHGATFL